MANVTIAGGTAHKLPDDLKQAVQAAPKAQAAWNSLTPLARNEWICWSVSVKQQATRKDHIKRTIAELQQGMRRPCCWLGCIHRKDKAVSPSVQAILDRQRKRVA